MKKNITLISLMLGVMVLVSMIGMVSATTYGGDITITDVQFNGASSVTVNPNENVDVEVTVVASKASGPYDPSNDWKSTKYKIEGGSEICIDVPEPDVIYAGTYSDTFVISAPANAGVYDFEVTGYKMENCMDGSSNTYVAEEAITIEQPICTLTITNPEEGDDFDNEAVPIEWQMGGSCFPFDEFHTWYLKDDGCNIHGAWLEIPGGQDLAPGEIANPKYPNYKFVWDKPSESGQYCIKVKLTSNGIVSYSDVFNVDLAPPEVSLSVGDNHVGECDETETGDCYVNQQTPITLTCAETTQDPWQSGVNHIEYRYSVDGGEFTEWAIYNGAFSFPEDTNHVLEYRCFDNVDKVDTESKSFIVDTVAPNIVKTITGDYIGTCPPEPNSKEDECWINYQTQIIATATDTEQPHPVGGVYCEWGYVFDGNSYGSGFECEGNVCTINFDEDTQHDVYVNCWDALGNYAYDGYERFYVDGSSPVTTLGYNRPHYTDGTSNWVDTISTISLTAIDNPVDSVCAVDNTVTYYREQKVDDEWCYKTSTSQWQTTSKEAEGWLTYSEPFTLPESCRAVEYYSVDALGNSEDVQVEFVFSDHTAPTPVKEVGKPSHECTAFDRTLGLCEDNWDWKVTIETPISLSCVDGGDHPSGANELCYRIIWDGDEKESSWVCIPEEQWIDGKVPVQFAEECEHTLEFYCTDNVGKTSQIDSEVFKVEGTSFEIDLDKKWNLISVPFNLLSTDVEEVFKDISSDVEGVWSYDNGEWKLYSPLTEGGDLTDIVPGKGYWVKTSSATTLLIGGSEMSPGPVLPSSVQLDKGWNLVGRYGLVKNQPAYCALFSLVDTQQGFPRWSSLWGYENGSFKPLSQFSWTNAGEGYWIEMDVEDLYSPSSVCYGFTQID